MWRISWARAAAAARLLAELAGFAALLFVTRFIARGHLVPQMDQECHIGGIAIDVLRHGVRFPLMVYAPNEYDNGSFFSGLLAAASFSLFGRNLLALKLVTHLICAAGAVATLWLLRGCLEELGLTTRKVYWAAVAVLIVEIAVAPRVVTLVSMYAVGNHAEGCAIDTILLALYSHRAPRRSAARTAAFWALVGIGLYLNKGTFLVIPVLGAAEVALGWRSRRRLVAALGGFVAGILPELLVVARRHAMGWATMASKAENNSRAFPRAFADSFLTLADKRPELLLLWVIALVAGGLLLAGALRRRWSGGEADLCAGAAPPVALALVVGVTCMHLAAMTVMAQGGLDAYAIYSYPALAVLVALLVAWGCAQAEAHRAGGGVLVGIAAVAMALVVYRPEALTWGTAEVSELWHDRAGAACSWRFAEGFMREQHYGLAPGQTREQHAIARCRSLSDRDQVLDCIGGIGRELNWRQGGRVHGTPPPELDAAERRAYAYYYGTHRGGDTTACRDFDDTQLVAECESAVQLDCLIFGDVSTRFVAGRGLGRPRCSLAAPPMDGYWMAMRAELLGRPGHRGPDLGGGLGDNDLRSCQAVFDACY